MYMIKTQSPSPNTYVTQDETDKLTSSDTNTHIELPFSGICKIYTYPIIIISGEMYNILEVTKFPKSPPRSTGLHMKHNYKFISSKETLFSG